MVAWLTLIQTVAKLFSGIATYLSNKQQQDAGRAIATLEQVKESNEKANEARKIKLESSNRTDDFKL